MKRRWEGDNEVEERRGRRGDEMGDKTAEGLKKRMTCKSAT